MAISTITSKSTSGVIYSGTAVASTSGTSIDFTGIPSWVKRITVMFNNVSTSGTSNILVQIGAGSVTTTGYLSGSTTFSGGTQANSTAGLLVTAGILATDATGGLLIISLLGSNSWVASGVVTRTSSSYGSSSAGQITLGGTLDRVRITTVNGTDTFDAGSINILYE